MRKLTTLFRTHPVLTTAFFLAATLTVLFTIRTIVFTIYWANPAHHDQPLEPWMTLRYVARSWDLPPDLLAQTLELDPAPRQRLSLREIAAQKGMTLEELTRRIATAAQTLRGAGE